MPITIKCQCGQSYRLKDDLAGKKVRCRKCGKVTDVPSASASGGTVTSEAPDAVRTAPDAEAASEADSGSTSQRLQRLCLVGGLVFLAAAAAVWGTGFAKYKAVESGREAYKKSLRQQARHSMRQGAYSVQINEDAVEGRFAPVRSRALDDLGLYLKYAVALAVVAVVFLLLGLFVSVRAAITARRAQL